MQRIMVSMTTGCDEVYSSRFTLNGEWYLDQLTKIVPAQILTSINDMMTKLALNTTTIVINSSFRSQIYCSQKVKGMPRG